MTMSKEETVEPKSNHVKSPKSVLSKRTTTKKRKISGSE